MQKKEKGEFGYLAYRKKQNLIKMLAAFFLVFAVLIVGLALNKWERNNVFTVVSVVLVLPAAKMAVGYFVVLPHHGAKEELEKKVKQQAGSLLICFDCIFSNSQKPIGTQAAAISDTAVCALTDNKNADVSLFEKSLKEFMKNDGCSVNVTLYKEEKAFMNKVRNMALNYDEDKDGAKDKAAKNKNSLLSMCI